MTNTDREISLEGKMDDWGPFGRNEGKWLIFSIGNPLEGHSYALPRNIDDIFSQRIAHLVSCRTGSRYVAHIPWSTDSADPIARDWAPKFIPVKELAQRLINYLKYHLKIYEEMGLPNSRVIIISGHGGNDCLTDFTDEIKNALELEKLIIRPAGDLKNDVNFIVKAARSLTMQLAGETGNRREIAKILQTILLSTGHAGHMEHSYGAALGILDVEKLEIMNRELEEDFEGALNKWPTLGGLGGFLTKGGKYLEAFGTEDEDPHGLWNCFKALKELDGGKIKIIKELGDLVIEATVNHYSNLIKRET